MDSNINYDFIIAGAGAAGCILASRLARSMNRPRVLLLEAGSINESPAARIDGERWLHRMNPTYNWGYKTIPQTNIGNRSFDYDRGKGVGGSTLINFGVWTTGAQADYEEIARLVGDENWSWSNTKERLKRIESYHGFEPDIAAAHLQYLNPKPEDHGDSGPIKVGFPKIWEKSMVDILNTWLVTPGIFLNPDINSGNPLGVGVMVNSAYQGIRSSAQDVLADPPSNLQIISDTEVARVTFQNKRANGVETVDGKKFSANKEVILCCGALNTPRVLMHSGIGPKYQLEAFDIPALVDNRNVGQHLMDHTFIPLTWERAEHTTTRHCYFRDKKAQATARAQWDIDHSGLLAVLTCSAAIGFGKSDNIVNSEEFKTLPLETKRLLNQPTLPHYEYILNCPVFDHFMDPENAVPAASMFVIAQNPQSTGSVRLQSADPKVPLLFNPGVFSHPFDRRTAIEATREVLNVVNTPAFSKDTVRDMHVPASQSDDDIWEYWQKYSGSLWHMAGTARMGKEKKDAVVDHDLKVFGVEGLRVADTSIYPLLVSGHTQTAGYLAGLVAGDKISFTHALDV